MFRKLIGTLTVLIFVIVGPVAGQLKIGYMNPQQVLNEMPEKTEIESELNNLIQQKRDQLQTRSANFQEAVAEYQQNASSMSEEQKQNREQELANMEQSLLQFQQSIQAEVQQRRAQLLQPIFNRMDRVISEIADEQNLDFVINEATGAGENIIFFVSDEKLNLTQEVINRMTNGTNQQN